MFKKVADIVNAELSGQYQLSSFRKVSSQATAAAAWWSPLSTEEHDQLMKTLTTNKFLALK